MDPGEVKACVLLSCALRTLVLSALGNLIPKKQQLLPQIRPVSQKPWFSSVSGGAASHPEPAQDL